MGKRCPFVKKNNNYPAERKYVSQNEGRVHVSDSLLCNVWGFPLFYRIGQEDQTSVISPTVKGLNLKVFDKVFHVGICMYV